jgi:hypothetical protein
MRGIAAAMLLVSAAHPDAALASCPDWQPPRVPTIEEARTSDLCKGTPFEPKVEALKRATPEADAKAQAVEIAELLVAKGADVNARQRRAHAPRSRHGARP